MSESAGSPLDRLAAVNAVLMAAHDDKCLDYSYRAEMEKMREESFDSPDNTGGEGRGVVGEEVNMGGIY